MVKPSDISKLTGQNWWTWQDDAQALLLAEGLWNAVDPSVPVPGGVVQMRAWTNDNQKAYGILYLTLNPAVQAKVNNAGVGKSGRLLWAQLLSFYTTSDPAIRSMLMSQLNTLAHDILKPADDFLQAVVTVESRLTAIAVSLPPFMVQDKILSGLAAVYSPITTVLQNESPPRSVPDMVTAINAWELADLQKGDSVIKAARRAERDSRTPNHGGVDLDIAPSALAARGGHFRRSTPSRSAGSKEFDWTNTKNRTDVCYRCGLPGHFAQYCISIMPDDVRQRILGRREPQANLADDFDTDTEFAAAAVDTGTHFALAVHDLPSELNFDTIDPTIRESYASALATPHPAIHESAFAVHVDPDIPPPSPTLTAATASVGGTPNKQRKKKKKKKKSLSPEEAHTAMLAQEIHDSDFSM